MFVILPFLIFILSSISCVALSVPDQYSNVDWALIEEREHLYHRELIAVNYRPPGESSILKFTSDIVEITVNFEDFNEHLNEYENNRWVGDLAVKLNRGIENKLIYYFEDFCELERVALTRIIATLLDNSKARVASINGLPCHIIFACKYSWIIGLRYAAYSGYGRKYYLLDGSQFFDVQDGGH